LLSSTGWYNLAAANQKAGQFAKAVEAYREYLALAPNDPPDAFYLLAESLRQSGHAREAIAAYRQYVAKERRESEQQRVGRAKERIAELEQSRP
jgi:tetratricopeptide (TPR) repeat protein